MASEPVIDHSDVAKAARDIHREYGGPGIMLKMADEIDRLRKMLADHGINPDGEYIAPNGLRIDAPASKTEVKF